MAVNIKTTQELIDNNLTILETNLNQTSPLNDKAFLRVMAVMAGMNTTQQNKLIIDRALASLALTALGNDLDTIGINYGVIRKPAVAAQFDASTTGTNGVVISSTIPYVGDSNGERYFPDTNETIAAGTATLNLTAQNTGIAGNLQVSDTLTIGSLISGASNAATVTSLTTSGTERESDDDYRVRVLDEIRTVGGGSNLADHRTWTQGVTGVARAYPYTGQAPFSGSYNYRTGVRTVFVQALESIDIDGIAPAGLLDDVRDAINIDPITGDARPCLGSTDETLYVESISRDDIYFEIENLTIPNASQETAAKADLEAELSIYAKSIAPYVEGLDSEVDRNDTVTAVTASEHITDVLKKYSGYATGVILKNQWGTPTDYITPIPGHLLRLDGITYV